MAGQRLQEGKQQQRITILLTSGHPYEYGQEGVTALLEQDMLPFVKDKLVDLGTATVNRGHAAIATPDCSTCLGGRPRRFGATQGGSGTW
jgi:hypothetical protein